MSEEFQPIGQVAHYFDRLGVAIVHVLAPMQVGDWIHIYGNKTNFVQQIESMEIERQKIDIAQPGDDIGMLVIEKVREGDWVYPYVPEE
jgi:translation elongation factor EF-Tu-like GTPase